MEQTVLGWPWTLPPLLMVHFCPEYDLWRALCFQNSSEPKKFLHLLYIFFPFASFILCCFENFCSWTPGGSWDLVPLDWSAQDQGPRASHWWTVSPLNWVLATFSFPRITPVATSRWRCEQVRLPRCDLHKPLKALNIYPQNSIKLFIKSNA